MEWHYAASSGNFQSTSAHLDVHFTPGRLCSDTWPTGEVCAELSNTRAHKTVSIHLLQLLCNCSMWYCLTSSETKHATGFRFSYERLCDFAMRPQPCCTECAKSIAQLNIPVAPLGSSVIALCPKNGSVQNRQKIFAYATVLIATPRGSVMARGVQCRSLYMQRKQ